MEFLVVIFFVINTLIMVWGVNFSRKKIFYLLSSSVINPIFLISIFQFINAILFASNFSEDLISHPRILFYSSDFDRLFAFFIFTMMNMSLMLGVLYGYVSSKSLVLRNVYRRQRTSVSTKLSINLFLILFLTLCVSILYVFFDVRSLSDLQRLTSNRFNIFNEFPLFLYLVALIRVFFVMYISIQEKIQLSNIFITLVVIILMLASGVRLNLLAVAVAIALTLAYRGYKITQFFGFLAFPVLGVFSILTRYWTRASSYLSFDELIDKAGGWVNIIFNPFEFHYYQTMTSIVTMSVEIEHEINRIPGESIWAAIFLPIPRSVMFFKGVSASTDYSMFLDPIMFDKLKSQATLGVFGVAQLEFGPVFGCLFVFASGYVISRLLMYSLNRGSDLVSVIIIFNLIIGSVIYTRTGITQIGQFVWPAIISYFAFKLLKSVISTFIKKFRLIK